MASVRSPNNNGKKTATELAVPAVTAMPTSRTPASVASFGRSGVICRCLKMLSVMTTALSTSMSDCGYVTQVDGLPVDRRDDGARHFLNALELIQRAHQEALRALFKAPAREVHVLGPQPARDGLDGKAELRQFLLIDKDLDLVLVAAADLHRGGTRHGFEIRFQAVLREAPEKLEPLFAVDGNCATGCSLVQEREAHHRFSRRIEAQ